MHSTSFATPAHNHFSLCSYRQTAPSGLGSQVQLNVEVLCQELTANIMKLEKVTHLFLGWSRNCSACWWPESSGYARKHLCGIASSLHDQTQPGDVTVNGKEYFFFFLVPPGNRFQSHSPCGCVFGFSSLVRSISLYHKGLVTSDRWHRAQRTDTAGRVLTTECGRLHPGWYVAIREILCSFC